VALALGRDAVKAITLADAAAQPHNNFNLIRLFAAWLVIYGHAWPVSGTEGQDLVEMTVGIRFAGALAVDVFFLVSGLLIAASLERNRLPAFLAARALRILPALWVCVALTVFVLGPVFTTAPDYFAQPETWEYLKHNLALVRDMKHFLPGVFDDLPYPRAVNGSLWSLPIEGKCYLFMAGVALLGLKAPWRFTAVVLVVVAGAVLTADDPLPERRVRMLWCAGFFLAGALAWAHRTVLKLHWAPLVALAVLGTVLDRAGLRSGYIAVYFATLAYGTLWLAYVPRLPQIRHHDFSYGVYLYGWPSQQLVMHFFPGTGVAGNVAGATVLAFALAAASWFRVEAPALRLKPKLRVRRAPEAAPDAVVEGVEVARA
jgi:peptidoglycan/LPS O-acetylase OafA/YrhL